MDRIHWKDFALGFIFATSVAFFYNIILTMNSECRTSLPNSQTILQENIQSQPKTLQSENIPSQIKTETIIEYKEFCPGNPEKYYLGFVKPDTVEIKSKEFLLKYYHDTPMNYEPLEPKITGPREGNLPLKSFVSMAVGVGSESTVDNIIQIFGLKNFTFMIFLYHPLNMTKFPSYPWFDQVFFVSYPGQMKWWYMKRFLTPIAMKHYEYIFILDDDVELDPKIFKPLEYIELLRKFNIHLSQPSHVPGSPNAAHSSTHQRPNNPYGHWNEFIECGPGTVFSSIIWQTCIWDLIQEDLTSGFGIDLIWHNYCKKFYGFDSSAIIDKYPMKHGNHKTSYNNGKKYDPYAEWRAYKNRFGSIVPEANGNNAGPPL